MPNTARTMESAAASATATLRASFMVRADTAPLLISSTWSVRMWTAGSASTMNQPSTAATAVTTGQPAPPASPRPRISPSELKPTLAPVRNSTSPAYVSVTPASSLNSARFFSRSAARSNSRKKARIGATDRKHSHRYRGTARS